MPRRGLQEISNSGRPGKSQATAVATGSPQTTTPPPQLEQKITGTMVEELCPSLLVVSQELLDIPVRVIISVEKLSGTLVIVDVGVEADASTALVGCPELPGMEDGPKDCCSDLVEVEAMGL